MVTPAVRLARPLRRGGMGSVWVAEHTALRTQVAVKFLSAELVADETSVARFSREAAAASQVKSPHVVQMFDHGLTDEGVPFIVMELLEGEEMTRRLEAGPLALPVVARIVTQVARALTRAHEKGIVHRDIKPDNIFLCDTGHDEVFVKLLDFGIAKGGLDTGLSARTATASLVGTPHYMSPEQAVGARDLDHRSDLWSLGMVAFQAMTGRRCFESDTIGALVLEIHTAELPRPSAFNHDLPPEVDAWFAKACARKIEDRFSNARTMAEALSAIAGTRTSRPPVPADVVKLRTTSPTATTEPPPPPPRKVPSLRPPQAISAADVAEAAEDESWKQDVDRTNRLGVQPVGPVSPRTRPRAMTPAPGELRAPIGSSRGSSNVAVYVVVGIVALVAVIVLATQTDLVQVLFPGLTAPSSSSPPPPPRAR